MDQIQKILIQAGRKDLAQEYYEKVAQKDVLEKTLEKDKLLKDIFFKAEKLTSRADEIDERGKNPGLVAKIKDLLKEIKQIKSKYGDKFFTKYPLVLTKEMTAPSRVGDNRFLINIEDDLIMALTNIK